MSWFSKMEELMLWAVTGTLAALASGIWWLIRRVVTNQHEIEILKLDLERRDQLRREDREHMMQIQEGVKNIQDVLMRREQ